MRRPVPLEKMPVVDYVCLGCGESYEEHMTSPSCYSPTCRDTRQKAGVKLREPVGS